MEGQPLSQTIAAKAPVARSHKLEWMVILCEALVHATKHGVTSLSIETADVIVGVDGRPHIVDLGLAPLVDAVGPSRDPSVNLAPETIAGGTPDVRSDIFGAGVLLYELITYQKPFGGGTADEIKKRIAGGEWVRHNDRGPELIAVVTRALQLKPGRRYQEFSQLLLDLRRIREQDDQGEATIISHSPAAPSARAGPLDVARVDLVRMRARRVEQALVAANAALGARMHEEALSYAEDALLIDPTSSVAYKIMEEAHAALRGDDNVRFTVYRPPVMAPQRWYPLLLFTHLGERRPGAPPDEPDPLALVDTTARGILGPRRHHFRESSRMPALAFRMKHFCGSCPRCPA